MWNAPRVICYLCGSYYSYQHQWRAYTLRNLWHTVMAMLKMIWANRSRAQPLPAVISFQWQQKHTIAECQAHSLFAFAMIYDYSCINDAHYVVWLLGIDSDSNDERHWAVVVNTCIGCARTFSEKSKMNYVRTHFWAILLLIFFLLHFFARRRNLFCEAESEAARFVHPTVDWFNFNGRSLASVAYLAKHDLKLNGRTDERTDVRRDADGWRKHFCASVTFVSLCSDPMKNGEHCHTWPH